MKVLDKIVEVTYYMTETAFGMIFKVAVISKLVSVTIIFPYPGYFLLVILHPLTPTLVLDYKSPVVHPVFGVESSLPPPLQDPIAVTPAP